MNNRNETKENQPQEIELLPTKKFIFLFTITLGLYNIWWMYKVWNVFKEREKSDIIPIARATFAIFFLYDLFEKIQNFSTSKRNEQTFSSIAYFIGFIAFNFSSRLPGGLWVISFLSVLCLVPALESFNYGIKHSKEYKIIENGEFNKNQILLTVVGTAFWALIVLGMLTNTVEN